MEKKEIKVPELILKQVFQMLISATAQKDDVRHTAVRWFNQLYYDIRKWNLGFIEFLHTYPGFKKNSKSAEFKIFTQELSNYHTALVRNDVKNDLCAKLGILEERYEIDFKWLWEEDKKTYLKIKKTVYNGRHYEQRVLDLALATAVNIRDLLYTYNGNSFFTRNKKTIKYIEQYAETSLNEVQNLHNMAQEIGVSLLTISEYETALLADSSRNPNIMIGEINLGDSYKISGQIGAVGPNARTQDVTFIHTGTYIQQSIDLEKLADELLKLRQEMKKESTNVEHDIAVSDIAKAEQAAKNKDANKVAEHLKSAGKWALDVAVKIGTPVAIEAIKKASGIT